MRVCTIGEISGGIARNLVLNLRERVGTAAFEGIGDSNRLARFKTGSYRAERTDGWRRRHNTDSWIWKWAIWKFEVKSVGTMRPARRAVGLHRGVTNISLEKYSIAPVAKKPMPLSDGWKVVRKDEVKSLGMMLSTCGTVARRQRRLAGISDEEHPKAPVTKTPTRLSDCVWIRNIVRKVEYKTLGMVLVPVRRAFSLVAVRTRVEEQSAAFVTMSPTSLSVHG